MAIWCEKNGKGISIQRVQDFEDVMESSVYDAMLEFFGCNRFESESFVDRIHELEEENENIRLDLEGEKEDAESECIEAENKNEDLERIIKHIAEMVSEIPEAKEVADYIQTQEDLYL